MSRYQNNEPSMFWAVILILILGGAATLILCGYEFDGFAWQ